MGLRHANVRVKERAYHINLRVLASTAVRYVAHRKDDEPLSLRRVPTGRADDDLIIRLPVHLALYIERVRARSRRVA